MPSCVIVPQVLPPSAEFPPVALMRPLVTVWEGARTSDGCVGHGRLARRRNRVCARYTARMPLPPLEQPTAQSPARNPAQVMLNSPLAAAARARVYHQRTRSRSRERGLRTFAALFALALHLLFLFGFVLGPAYEVKPPRPSKDQFLQVRLVEPPEPPPPPPVRGTPPKEKGPRHQGRSRRAAASAERSVNSEAVEAAPPAVSAPPVIAKAAKTQAVVAKPRAAPKPPASLPQPAPTAELQPVPLAGEPPVVTVPRLALQPPIPPKFQPESVRSPQLEGTRPLPGR